MGRTSASTAKNAPIRSRPGRAKLDPAIISNRANSPGPGSSVYKSGVKAAIHQTARDLYDGGVIDKQTMRRFDESCLTPVHEFTAEEIRALRKREEVSQSVFAHYLNVSKDSVSQWERGQKKPAGASLKLLSLVDRKGLETIA